MLYLIGLGLTCKDISLSALESIKKCKKIYLENYTSLGCSKKELESLIKKDVIIANRELIENNSSKILNEAKKYRKIYFVEEEVSKGITGNVIGGLISLYRPEVLNGLEHTIITHLPSIEKKLPKCSTKYRQQVSDSALCWP